MFLRLLRSLSLSKQTNPHFGGKIKIKKPGLLDFTHIQYVVYQTALTVSTIFLNASVSFATR